MRFLLDTNVVSELYKARKNVKITDWIDSQAQDDLFLSVLTLGELRRGALMLRDRDPLRSTNLLSWIDDLETIYRNRVLPVTLNVAMRWGDISTDRSRPFIDTYLAATAIEHGLVLVTKNVKDIRDTSVDYVNPFEL